MPNTWLNTGKGYFSNDTYSQSLLAAVQPDLALKQFARKVPIMGKLMGDTIQIPKYYNINRAAGAVSSISEQERIPEFAYDTNKTSLTVREYGAAVPITEKFLTLSAYDVNDITSTVLKNDMVTVINGLIGTAMKATYVKYTPTGSSGSPTYLLDDDGTLSSTATRNLAVKDLYNLPAIARDYYKMKPYSKSGGLYQWVMVAPYTVLSVFLQDATIQTALNVSFTGAKEKSPLLAGSLGVYNGIMFVPDNSALATTMGATAYNGEFLFFGDDPVAEGTAIAPEVRRKTGQFAEDYGRDQGAAWYGLFGYQIPRGDNAIDVAKKQVSVIHGTSL